MVINSYPVAEKCIMTHPTISIIIPSYNQGRYIEETLLSIFRQRIEGLQLIVFDGGSTDETLSILKKYESKIDVCVSEPDQGQTDAINKGLKLVKGDIVGWINSDDIYLPGALKKVLSVFQKHADVDVVHGDRLLLDAKSSVVGWVCGEKFLPSKYGFNVNSETAFWRARLLPEGLDASLKFAMDLDWFSRLYVADAKFHFIPDFLGAFRCHDENKSSNLQDVCMEESERCWVKHFSNDKWKISAPGNRRRMYYKLLSRPLMLTVPYFHQRFSIFSERNRPAR